MAAAGNAAAPVLGLIDLSAGNQDCTQASFRHAGFGPLGVSGREGRFFRGILASIRGSKLPYRKFNLTVRELPPFLNDWRETAQRRLTYNFAGLAASRVEGQRKRLWLLPIRHPI
jgi:hypothetical protein